jgi:DNA polymerase-3 subunit alpha
VHGLGVRVKVRAERPADGGEGAAAEVDLGDAGRFWPSDDALARWKQLMPQQPPQVVYD